MKERIDRLRAAISSVHGERERDILEKELNELESELQSQAELLDLLVHDLKNPLASLLMNVTLEKKLIQNQGPSENELLLIITRNQDTIQRTKTLLQDFVDFAKSRLGALDLRRVQRDAKVMLRDALREVESSRAKKNIEFKREIDPQDLVVMADFEKSALALVKVLEFAIRVSPRESTIQVGVAPQGHERVEAGVDPERIARHTRYARNVVFRVKLPPGSVPVEAVSGIFERKGKDLGLALARGIVQALGGCAVARENQGNSLELAFTLPAA